MDSSSPTLRISEVAERTGLSIHALRFYERENLLVSPITRTTGGRRSYTETDVEWLAICVRLRESGMPLADLRDLAGLVRQGPGNEDRRLGILRKHERHIRDQLDALRSCLNIIQTKISIYQDKIDQDDVEGVCDPYHPGR